jgi:hypothetical protein
LTNVVPAVNSAFKGRHCKLDGPGWQTESERDGGRNQPTNLKHEHRVSLTNQLKINVLTLKVKVKQNAPNWIVAIPKCAPGLSCVRDLLTKKYLSTTSIEWNVNKLTAETGGFK